MAGDGGDDRTLIKIAVFCITMSIVSTCMITWFIAGSSDYGYDTINMYRDELTEFSGGSLVDDNPWVLKAVYTPFTPASISDDDIADHIEYDNGRNTGWLFGEKITDYPDLDQAVDIHLDKDQKSNTLLTVSDPYDYRYQSGREVWNGGNEWGIILINPKIVSFFTGNPDEGYTYSSGTANTWSYTGYRYVFDPTLPFTSDTSSKDGRLSLVWYDIEGDTGLSGALEVYMGKESEQVLLGRISASQILNAFQSTDGYVSTFDFNFEGTHLNLTIRFPPTVYNDYLSLREAWDDGAWSMAVSSASAGNFFDVENSNAFSITAGSMFDTFIDIFTFEYTHIETGDSVTDSWVEAILWLLVGLPMTLGLLCVVKSAIGGVFKIF